MKELRELRRVPRRKLDHGLRVEPIVVLNQSTAAKHKQVCVDHRLDALGEYRAGASCKSSRVPRRATGKMRARPSIEVISTLGPNSILAHERSAARRHRQFQLL